ncbi:acetyltransferase [Halobacillus sp. BBL2006]|nr:acetyltransferase [Halobacillus sp. BBL2006]
MKLVPMTQEEYDSNMEAQIESYADEKVKAGTWTEEEALAQSLETFKKLLPKGLNTPEHHFLSIRSNDCSIGYFWYHFDPSNSKKEAFIYNFLIFEDHQGKGSGQKALSELERHIKLEGVKKLSLHVFGHNKRAIHLYNKLQFETTDLVMSKYL